MTPTSIRGWFAALLLGLAVSGTAVQAQSQAPA